MLPLKDRHSQVQLCCLKLKFRADSRFWKSQINTVSLQRFENREGALVLVIKDE